MSFSPLGLGALLFLGSAGLLAVLLRKKQTYSSGLARTITLPKNSQVKQVVTGLPNGSTLVVPNEGNASGDVVDYKAPVPADGIRKSKTGVASAEALTVTAVFRQAAARCPEAVALVSCEGKRVTWREYVNQAETVGRALMACKLPVGGAINIIGFNSPEWMLLNMGAICASAIAAGVYTSNGRDACLYIAQHSKATVVGVENKEHLLKYVELCDNDMPDLQVIVVWSAKTDAELPDLGAQRPKRVKVLSWSSFLKLAEAVPMSELDKRIKAQKPGETSTLIYTSGTTGNPKAVEITHDNAMWTARCVWGVLLGDDDMSNESGGIRFVSYLPLSHIAAQMIDIHAPIFATAYLEASASVWYADANALRGSLSKTLVLARPTYFFGVPRVWEKMQAAIMARGKEAPALRRRIAAFARGQGLGACRALQNEGDGRVPLLWPLAKRLLKAAHVAMGLDRCRMCITGAAPINVSVLEFFSSLGINVLELYGMSECTGPTTMSHQGPGKGWSIGSCGRPMPGTELKIEHVKGRDPVGHGEICFRGRHIMPGYLYDEKKTKEAIDAEGWLHSGDVGVVGEDGMLRITGRIKELLISAGGENVPPVPIEEALKSAMPAISNCVLIGDKRKFFVVLVTPRLVPNADGSFTDKLDGEAKLVDPAATTAAHAATSAKWRAYIQTQVDVYNKKAVSNAQTVKKFTVLACDLSVPGGELGPTLKLKRNVVNEKFAKEIDALYAGAED